MTMTVPQDAVIVHEQAGAGGFGDPLLARSRPGARRLPRRQDHRGVRATGTTAVRAAWRTGRATARTAPSEARTSASERTSWSLAWRQAKIVRNPEASRAKILDAARIEFVTHGLSGGRVDRIAEQSGVNKNLIYHYFGSKDALYLSVLEGIYADLRAHQHDQDLRGLEPVEGMKRLVSSTFDHFVATPDLIRLMSIENIHYAASQELGR